MICLDLFLEDDYYNVLNFLSFNKIVFREVHFKEIEENIKIFIFNEVFEEFFKKITENVDFIFPASIYLVLVNELN